MIKDAFRIAELEKSVAASTAELIQLREELAVINSVQEALVNEMDMQAIYDLVGNKIQDVFDAQAVIIASFDQEAGNENFHFALENGERFYLNPRPFDKLRQHLIEAGKRIIINTSEEAFEWFGKDVLPGTKYMKSGVFVPLMTNEKKTGYVSLQNVDKEYAFSDSEIRLLETLANSMSTALQNARLLKETEQRTAELAVINSVQEGLAKELDMQSIYDLVGNRIRELFDAQVVGIATFDHARDVEHIHYLIEKGERYYPVPRPLNTLRKHIIQTREKIVINKNFEVVTAAFGVKTVPGTEPPKSALYMPLIIGEKVTGYVSLQNIDRENAFSDADVRLLETLANTMGVALENARLFDETTRLLKETEQQKAELGVINSVQEGLAKELDMQAIYDLVGERIRKLFKAQAVIIATFDHDTATEHFKYLIEDGQRFYMASRPYDRLRQHLIVNRQKIVINTDYAEAYAKFGLRTLPGTNVTKSGVFVPLIIGDKVNSYISLQNNETENAFSESDIRLLETLANSMSVALENARLFDETTRLLKETEQRTAELAVINSVQEGLAHELEIQAIYDLVGNKIREVFDAQGVIIATFDHDTGVEKFNFLIEKGERFFAEPRRYDKLRYELIMKKQKILINDNIDKAFADFGLKVVQGTESPKSLLFVPLIVGNKVTSYVSLQNVDRENAFSESDVRLLETLANSMSVALENARLFDETARLLKETEQQKAELGVITSVQEGMAKELEMQAIYDLVGEKIRQIFNAQVIDIVTYDPKMDTIEDRYSYEKGDTTILGSRKPDGFRKHIIESGKTLLINTDAEKVSQEYGVNIIIGQAPKSALFVPLVSGGRVNGVISLQNINDENAFSEAEVNLLTTLANSMSVALENARLFDETTRLLKETEQQKAELGVITSVQEGMAKELEMQAIYDLVGEKIRQIFNAQVIDIVTYDPKMDTIEDRYAYEKGDTTLLGSRKPDGFRKHIVNTGKTLLINNDVEKVSQDYNVNALIGQVPKSVLFVPLVSGGKVNGIISLQNLNEENAFSEAEVNLLTTLANSMSVALENARLFDETNRLLKETDQRNAELAVINSVQESLVAKMDMQSIYDLVGEKIRELFDAQVVDIVTYNHVNSTIEDRYAYEKGDRTLLGQREINGFRKHVAKTKQILVHNENVEQAMVEYDNQVLIGEIPKSQVYVPMIAGGEVKGIISLQNVDHEHAFSDSDVNLITTLANSMSVALESARLFDETARLLKETEQRTRELSVINSVQDGLAKELDIQGIYELVGEKMREIFNAQVFDIVTYNKKTGLIEDRYNFEKGDRTLLPPRSLIGFRKWVIEHGQPLMINEDIETHMQKYGNVVVAGEHTKSVVFVPIMAGGEATGVMSLQNIDEENAFSDADVRLLTTLGNSMTVALENARLFDETTRLLKETEQRTAELAVINSVQDGLVREMDIQAIYELVGIRIGELFDTQTVLIRTFDHETEKEHWQYVVEKGERYYSDPRPFNWANKQLIKSKQPLLINDNYLETAKKYGGSGVTKGHPPKSAMFVPMMVGDIVKGSVSLQNIDRENAFSESDLRLLTTLTNSMSVALENARLFDETTRLLKETEQRTAELAVINSVQDGLAKELDMQGVYNLVGNRIQKLFNAQAVIIATFDLDSQTEFFNYVVEDGELVQLEPRPINKLRQLLIEKKESIYIATEELAVQKYGVTPVAGTKMPKSLLFVPLLSGHVINGYVSLQNIDIDNAFSVSDIQLLETLASSMSVAIENARLFDETNRLLKETEQRTTELAVINSVQEGLAAELDIQGIYELVGDRLCELFPDTQTLVIRTFDHNAKMEHFHYAIEKGERFPIDSQPFIWASKQLISNHKPIHINENYVETSMKFGGTGVTKGQPPKSAVFVPMIVGDVVKGSVSLQNVDKEHAFSDSDVRLLTTIANSMIVAIENARLFDETTRLLSESKQRATELSTVNSISKALASQLDPADLINMVGDQLKDLFNANIVYIALLNPDTKIINFPYQFGDNMEPLQLGDGLTSKIIQSNKPILINKDLQELRKQMGVQLIGVEAASYLGVPIPLGEKNIGVLSVQSTVHENRFDENDLRLLTTIASSVGVALNNATLFEDVRKSKLEAEAASKAAEKANEAKSAFLSTVSHELRTPLTSVLGFAKIIRKRLEERIFPAFEKTDPKTEKTINQISENLKVVISEGERLTHLINDVLDLAKIEAGKMEWNQEVISMPEVAERAIAASSALFDQKSLKLIRQIDNRLPEITGDKDKLIQVIINLISNAVKFTDKGSVTCKVFKEKDEIIVSISDTGIGIAPEDFAAVFEQFKQVGGDTLTDKPKGTGLGLPICKEIVEHHGGRLWVDSTLGEGSTFSFALPVNKKKTPERPVHLIDLVKQLKEQVAHSDLQINGHTANILIVDDDDSIRSLLLQELGDAGYIIQEAKNGKEALEKVRSNRPDLIILDIMMPEMNGFDVAAVLKNDPQTMDIPIMVLSVVQDKARGFRIGVDRYLTKPIDTGILFKEIGSLLEQGKSKKKVMIVDEDSGAVKTLTEVLQAKGYEVTDSVEKDLVEKAKTNQPDIIMINSALSGKQNIVQTLRFEKGLEKVLFVVYQ